MKRLLICAAVFLPSQAFALVDLGDLSEDISFQCDAPDAAHEHASAKLTIYANSHNGTHYDGHLTSGDLNADLDIYDGLDTLLFLHVSENAAFNYTIYFPDLEFDYTASGGQSDRMRGTCTRVEG